MTQAELAENLSDNIEACSGKSEHRRRGRPRSVALDTYAQVYGNLTTRRSLNNVQGMLRARRILEQQAPELLAVLEAQRIRRTVFYALGRIKDHVLLVHVARHFTEHTLKAGHAIRVCRILANKTVAELTSL